MSDYIKRSDVEAELVGSMSVFDGRIFAEDALARIADIPSADVVPRTTDGEFIRREDAINALAISQGFGGINTEKLNNLLYDIPSAYVVERKRGEWVQISPAKIYECSVCEGNVMTDDIDLYWYCHQCGAKMEKE